MFTLTKGKIIKPIKVVIYAPEGIGKSTFASKFPSPVFIDTEGSTNHMDVNRMPNPTSWSMLLEEVKFMKEYPDIGRSLVIDTVDWADQLCVAHICASNGQKSIEGFGYGKGYVFEAEEFARFLHLLDDVIDAGVNVVLCAHAMLRKFEQPEEMGAYDRYELKIGTKTGSRTAALVKEWADLVLFANYKTITIKNGEKTKAQGGKRVMYTTHHPNWDAKNRFGLPDEVPFDYASIAECVPIIEPPPAVQVNATPQAQAIAPEPSKAAEAPKQEIKQMPPAQAHPVIPKALQDMMDKDKITLNELQIVITQSGFYPEGTPISKYESGFIDWMISTQWVKVVDKIKANRNEITDETIPF